MKKILATKCTFPLLRACLLLMVGLALLSSAAYSQDKASIVGTVTDASGAAVVGATITITNTETGFVRTTETNSTGSYAARELTFGHYRLRVEAKGFKAYEQTAITLNVNDVLRIDAALQVGTVTESVVIESNPIQVQADTNEVSQTITGTQIEELATNGRNVLQLAALVPGASSTMPDFDVPLAQYQNRNVYYNGNRQDHNNWMIDGGEAYDRGGGGILIVSPSQDGIAEFKVMSSNYAADMGLSSGGMVSMAIKGGTSNYHGSGWLYNRSTGMNAIGWMTGLNHEGTNSDCSAPDARSSCFKSPMHYYADGFNLGGPVGIPKVGTLKKTFFFYNMEWRKLYQGNTTNPNAIPSALWGGDFTGYPTITVPQTSDPAMLAKFSADELTPGQPFPSNKIPTDLLDANALKLVNAGIFPAPNSADHLHYFSSAPSTTNNREEMVRIDHQLTDKLGLFGHLIYDSGNQNLPTPLWSGESYPTLGSSAYVPSWAGVVHATYTINPSLLNEAAFNWNGNNITIGLTGNYTKPEGYDVPQFFSGNTLNKMPGIQIHDPFGVNFDTGSWPWHNTWRSYQFRDDLSWSHGTHNVRFGGSFMWTHKMQDIFGKTNGNYDFNGAATGNSVADFLLGFANTYNELALQDHVNISFRNISFYGMDDWRVTKRLTLNLGLRWEGQPHAYDSNNRLSNFYPKLFDPAVAPVPLPPDQCDAASAARHLCWLAGYAMDPAGPGFGTVSGVPLSDVTFYLNGIGLAGRNGIPKGLVDNTYKTFAPRVGFAFDVMGNQKTIVRGGFGMFYERIGGNEEYNMGPNSPFSYSPTVNDVYLSNPATSWIDGTTASSPIFPAGIWGVTEPYRIPTSQQWSLGVQQQLRPNAVLTVSYVGNSNFHQSDQHNDNLLPLDSPHRADVCGTACGGTPTNSSPYRNFPGWANLDLFHNEATSNYNSLQVSLRATAWKNLTFSAAYTWSHAFDIVDGELWNWVDNPYNVRYDYGTSGFDRRHVALFTYVYEFPFFKNSDNRAAKTLLGGWTLSGVTTFESGTPLNVGYDANNLGLAGGGNRANQSGSVHYEKSKTSLVWFDTSVFSKPAPLTWGNAPKNSVVGPGRNNWNMSLFKTFKLTESKGLEIRAETFNTFNHPQPSSIDNGINSGSFGHITGFNDMRVLQLGGKVYF